MSDVTVESKHGDLQVVVFLPGNGQQLAYGFRPDADSNGLRHVPRRDLSIIRAMLQDALDDVDDERHRRAREDANAVMFPQPQPMPVPPRPLPTW